MILLEQHGRRYRCSSAFIASVQDEERLRTVTSRADVAAFLRQHPDRYFFLIHESTQEDDESSDEDVVFCGLVKFDSKSGTLLNKRFTFRD